MNSKRSACTGLAPVHLFLKPSALAIALALTAAPLSGAIAAPALAAQSVVAGQSVGDFYRMRNGAPLWLGPASADAAQQLIVTLSNASFDGLDPDRYQVSALSHALRQASRGDRRAIERADRQLSDAYVAYLGDLRRDPGGVMYVDAQLRPAPPTALAALLEAAAAPSLSAYVRTTGFMNPIYGELRQALVRHKYSSPRERELLRLNLQRARALPAGNGRFIMVNVAQQRLFTWENGRVVDSMRVVVGKPKHQTPTMSALVRFAALNPYWYVPPDLAAERIAPKVLKQGLNYLDQLGYQVLSDWASTASVIDPATIDWQAVADGKLEVMMRQRPGPRNSMGRLKFMFPNAAGVYLHDNPERELFSEASRLYSGGCVRLEDAARLGKWLFGRPLNWESAGTEEKVDLPTPVPVYITYLTAVPEAGSIAFLNDVYGRDAGQLALSGSSPATANGKR